MGKQIVRLAPSPSDSRWVHRICAAIQSRIHAAEGAIDCSCSCLFVCCFVCLPVAGMREACYWACFWMLLVVLPAIKFHSTEGLNGKWAKSSLELLIMLLIIRFRR